jgi:hypothetical protein
MQQTGNVTVNPWMKCSPRLHRARCEREAWSDSTRCIRVPGAHAAEEPADRDDVGHAVARQQEHQQLHHGSTERGESRLAVSSRQRNARRVEASTSCERGSYSCSRPPFRFMSGTTTRGLRQERYLPLRTQHFGPTPLQFLRNTPLVFCSRGCIGGGREGRARRDTMSPPGM